MSLSSRTCTGYLQVWPLLAAALMPNALTNFQLLIINNDPSHRRAGSLLWQHLKDIHFVLQWNSLLLLL